MSYGLVQKVILLKMESVKIDSRQGLIYPSSAVDIQTQGCHIACSQTDSWSWHAVDGLTALNCKEPKS